MNQDGQTQIVRIAGFGAGVLSEKRVGRIFPIEALVDGLNLDLSARSIRTRKGYDVLNSGATLTDSIVRLKQANFPSPGVTRLLAQVEGAASNKLYASKTALPSTSVTFSEIYDLSDGADILDITQLNDRSILTEIVKNHPLVWGGVMETDGSDWMIAKAVLVSWDGTNFHNITENTCDPDAETSEGIGGMTSSSALYFCFDVPILGDLYLVMGTGSTTITEDIDETTDIDLDAVGDIQFEDYRNDITKWVQDAGATGHFESSGSVAQTIGGGVSLYTDLDLNAAGDIDFHDLRVGITNWVKDGTNTGHFTDGATAQTLGAGNDSPDVEVGCVCTIDGTDYYIVSITDDGEASGEVELSSDAASALCSAIQALEYSGGVVQPSSQTDAVEPDGSKNADTDYATNPMTATDTPYDVDSSTSYSSTFYNWKGADQDITTGWGSKYTSMPKTWRIDLGVGNGMVINKYRIHSTAWRVFGIGDSGSNPYNFKLQGSNDDSSWDDLDTRTGKTHSTGAGSWSSWYTFSNSTSYRYYRLYIESVYGGSSYRAYLGELKLVEAETPVRAPTAIDVAHTNDTAQLDCSTWVDFQAVSVAQTTPGSSAIYHAVSFDDRATWRVYKGSAWVEIVKFDAVWKYWDGAAYQAASSDTMIQALKQALNDSDNQWTQTEIEVMTESDWEAANGWSGAVNTVDFAWAMDPYRNDSDDDIPTLDKYTITYKTAAANDSPLVEAGSRVSFSDTDLYIVSITDDGEASGEIELSAAHGSADVDLISSVDVTSGSVTISTDGASVPAASPVFFNESTLQVDTTSWTGFKSIAITSSHAGSSTAYYCFSFDDQATWKVYLVSTWITIVQFDSVWKYWNGSAYVASDTDDMASALRQALNVPDNQMNEAAVEAMAQAQWEATGGWSTSVDTFDVGGILIPDGVNRPTIDKYTITHDDQSTVTVEGYDGTWTELTVTTDGTQVAGASLAQTGVVDLSSSFSASLHSVDGISGFWYRLSLPTGTSAGTTLAGVRFSADCQELARISPDGIVGTPVAVLYVVAALGAYKDITDDVGDATVGTAQYLNDGGGTPTGWTTSDKLWIASDEPFSSIKITLGKDASTQAVENNQNAAILTVKYWNGTALAAVGNMTDGTASGGNTLSQDGQITFSTPSDWKQHNPIGGAYPAAYWVELTVNATLTADLSLAEVGMFSVPTDLVKYGHCATKLSRLLLGERSNNKGQVDVSRTVEEYGIQSGDDSYSYTPGTQDSVVAIVPLYNEAVIVTQRYMYVLSGDDPADFTVERQDVADQVPISSRALVLAPKSGQESGLQTALYYLNYAGVFSLSGFQTRIFTGLSREAIGDLTDWWDESNLPYLDKDNLHVACGEYWPEKDLVVFAVPMIYERSLNAAAVVDKGGGTVGFAATAHGLSTSGGDVIYVVGLANYAGPYTTTAATTTNEIVVTAAYVAETVTEAGKWYPASQTSNNRLICYDIKTKTWHPPRDIAVDSLCLAFDRNTAAPGNLGKRALLGGTSDGFVLRLFDDSYEDDDGSNIAWWGETGWTDLKFPDRKRISRITAWGLTAGDDITIKIYRDGSRIMPDSGWEFTLTALSGLATTLDFDRDPRDPFLTGWVYKFIISGSKRADFFLDVEYEPYPGVT